jgi:hypothetical protein
MIGFMGALALLASVAAIADPPSRAARLTQMSGTITFSPAGEDEWAIAQANRPVITGDRLWSDAGSHAELEVGTAGVRLGSETSVDVLNFDDRVMQLQLAQGTVNLRVNSVVGDQFYEIDTPNLAFSVRRAGDYRIDVDPAGNTTVLSVRSGEGEAWGEGAGYTIGAGQRYTFTGEGLRDYSTAGLPPADDFDRWTMDRNRREDAAAAARYVSPQVVGYSDLDDYGTWRSVEGYGNVWVPTSVATGWAPYHYGHWAWVEPWGWTWIDDAPWGFAPFHYGRWAYLSSRWCWVPGPIAVRPVYAPALVAFVGGAGFSLAISSGPVAGIGWFPLGVGEVYRPAYAVSRNYFTNVNVSNTVVNTTVINNYYTNTNVTNVVYKNREVAGAVTAVPTTAFASGRAVRETAVSVSRDELTRARVEPVAAVAPSRASVIAAAGVAGAAAAVAVKRPSEAVLTRRVVAKTTPAAQPPSFAARQQLLAAQPGKPLEAEKLNTVRSQRSAAERNVKVVTPSTAAIKPLPTVKGGAPGAQAQQERALRQEKQGPATAEVPRPPQDRREAQQQRQQQSEQPQQARQREQQQQERASSQEKRGPGTAEVPRPPQDRREAQQQRQLQQQQQQQAQQRQQQEQSRQGEQQQAQQRQQQERQQQQTQQREQQQAQQRQQQDRQQQQTQQREQQQAKQRQQQERQQQQTQQQAQQRQQQERQQQQQTQQREQQQAQPRQQQERQQPQAQRQPQQQDAQQRSRSEPKREENKDKDKESKDREARAQ